MTSLMTSSVFVIACSMMTVQFAAACLSNNVLDFMATLNGIYDYNDQKAVANFVFVQKLVKPVYVPALQKDPMIYIDEAKSGISVTMLVESVTEDPKNGKIDIHFYSVINYKRYRFNTFNTENLKNYTEESFQPFPEYCSQQFSRLSAGKYAGVFPVCKELGLKDYDTFTLEITCDAIIFIKHFNSTKKNDVTNVLKRRRQKFPLLCAPAGYRGPCNS